jgi:hypothetical protein
MTIITTGRLQVGETSDRQRAAVQVASDGTALGSVQGYLSGLVLTKTAGLSWSLSTGRAVIAAANAANGPVIATVTVAETGAWAAGDATRDRIDILTLSIDETATIANGNPPVKVNIIQGAYPAAGGPLAPAVPAGQLALWQEYIAAGTSVATGWDTTKLTDLRQQLLGGLAPANPAVPFAMAAGTASITVASGANTGSVAITFPAGRFSVAPKVTLGMSNAQGGSQSFIPRSYNETATGATVALYIAPFATATAPNGFTQTIDWVAVQMTATAAAG